MEISEDGYFTIISDSLTVDTRYYYSYYTNVHRKTDIRELDIMHPSSTEFDFDMSSATDLSSSVSANCYIVSSEGCYKFKTVQGNSRSSVGEVASATVIWETFGMDVTPERRDLIAGVCYENGISGLPTKNLRHRPTTKEQAS